MVFWLLPPNPCEVAANRGPDVLRGEEAVLAADCPFGARALAASGSASAAEDAEEEGTVVAGAAPSTPVPVLRKAQARPRSSLASTAFTLVPTAGD